MTKGTESGDFKMLNESIESVIARCRDRIDKSLDCSVGDIIRLIDEIEKTKNKKHRVQTAWEGFGTGD